MNPTRHRIITIALDEVGYKGGSRYDKEGLWCGAFVVWCLREAGLKLESGHSTPGRNLCASLPRVNAPEPGDIVRYKNDHCAIILDYTSGGVCTVDGAKLNEVVSTKVQLFAYTQPMTFYSISELIRCYEMTGAETPEYVK